MGWWEADPNDSTNEATGLFRAAVLEKLKALGVYGSAIGKPLVRNAHLLAICVLDPQNEVPQTLKLLTESVGTFVKGEKFNPAISESFSYSYDPEGDNYTFIFSQNDRDVGGTCDKSGNIISIQEISTPKTEEE
jgi:hypothetical protein